MSKPHPVTEVRNVSPTQAKNWLSKNAGNRPIRDKHVRALAEAMKKGQWRLTNQAIGFDANGNLADGQHRLYAVIESGKTVKMMVTTGLEPEVRNVIDTGVIRNAGQALYMAGITRHYKDIAAACRLLYHYERGTILSMTNYPTSNDDILDVYRTYPSLAGVSVDCAQAAFPVLRMSVGIFIHHLCSQKDEDLCELFLDSIGSGSNLRNNSGTLLLRNWLMNVRTRRDVRQPASYEVAAMAIKAWNAERQSKTLSRLAWRRAGAAEDFPEVV